MASRTLSYLRHLNETGSVAVVSKYKIKIQNVKSCEDNLVYIYTQTTELSQFMGHIHF
jgi:hypothetical protein